ncbi:MAG: hypothetical protein V8S95_06120 [Odoribacter sp.]
MNAIMAEYELPVRFPDNVLKAAEKIPFRRSRKKKSVTGKITGR